MNRDSAWRKASSSVLSAVEVLSVAVAPAQRQADPPSPQDIAEQRKRELPFGRPDRQAWIAQGGLLQNPLSRIVQTRDGQLARTFLGISNNTASVDPGVATLQPWKNRAPSETDRKTGAYLLLPKTSPSERGRENHDARRSHSMRHSFINRPLAHRLNRALCQSRNRIISSTHPKPMCSSDRGC